MFYLILRHGVELTRKNTQEDVLDMAAKLIRKGPIEIQDSCGGKYVAVSSDEENALVKVQ